MFKTLLKQVGDYKRDTILTPVLVILEVIMEVIIPMMMAAVIDYGLKGQDLKTVCLIGIGMIVMAGLALFFGVESGKTASSASSGFAMNLRQAMYERIQTFSFSNIVFHGRACDQDDHGRDERAAGVPDVHPHLCEGADYAGQCDGDDISDPSPFCPDFSGSHSLPGCGACPDFIKGQPDFKEGVP